MVWEWHHCLYSSLGIFYYLSFVIRIPIDSGDNVDIHLLT